MKIFCIKVKNQLYFAGSLPLLKKGRWYVWVNIIEEIKEKKSLLYKLWLYRNYLT